MIDDEPTGSGPLPDFPTKVTRSQCLVCHEQLALERTRNGHDPQVCTECRALAKPILDAIGFPMHPGIPRAGSPAAAAFKKVALCQCLFCERYLAENRLDDNTFLGNCCVECAGPNALPLAAIRGTLTDACSLEILALLSEECAEVVQRNSKIVRWGWAADFEGTTQQAKLESELGDVLAALIIAATNGAVTYAGVLAAADAKLAKFREDAAGPRQRLLHAEVPAESATVILADHTDRDY